jgi:Xaa-Pro aminopeptidase
MKLPKTNGAVASRRELPKLIIAASEVSADMLYACQFYVPDAFLFLKQNGHSTILLSDLEVDRGRKQAKVDEVLSMSEYAEANKKALGKKPSLGKVAVHFLRSRKVRRALVPDDFPLGLSRELERGGVAVQPPKSGPFWPERVRKTKAEVAHLKRALEITQVGMARGLEVLAAAKGKGELTWGGATLTSERLRAEIDSAILHAGGLPANTIVAGGDQACDPHERGSGPLRGGELIIIDIFPRDAASGYYGDLTRTVVKGRASEAKRALWQAVQDGQRLGIEGTRAGADGQRLHEQITALFKERGFPTEIRDGRHVGFFHGTGHGLGLEIHDEPRFQKTRKFEAGMVFTIEPGLYYPGLGGVRLEDVVAVRRGGMEMLSNFEQRLEV